MICTTEKKTEPLMKIKEVAERLNVSRTIVYEIIHSEGFPLVKLGPKKYRVYRDKLERWIANSGRSV
ncbi:AlpA family transcriptional regulator [Anaerospora hongkongensis]|uniref:AlpA family transcriptional regulator n=1 Tax=Anaerospora hongkongensis TaxID=244830 RepID=A0A4R1Q4T5_9FIRM|nr:excisionase family DNA-binding protein [Anaerospora hongkongensis]TCL40032.1 AlpA family transcriptional regulator [Anaerospora hongkongensis]